MCRYTAWIGRPRTIASLVNDPQHGLAAQSKRSREALMVQHADGSGVLWYRQMGRRPERYLNAAPAWRDSQLTRLAKEEQSPLFLAHVRAATRAARCLRNCHPFTHDRLGFMHNGELGNIDRLAPALRRHCGGAAPKDCATDSELFFCLLRRYGVDVQPQKALNDVVKLIRETATRGRIPYKLRLSAVLSDGQRLQVVRYATDSAPPSLYSSRTASGTAFASEPIGKHTGRWRQVPANSLTTATRAGSTTVSFNP